MDTGMFGFSAPHPVAPRSVFDSVPAAYSFDDAHLPKTEYDFGFASYEHSDPALHGGFAFNEMPLFPSEFGAVDDFGSDSSPHDQSQSPADTSPQSFGEPEPAKPAGNTQFRAELYLLHKPRGAKGIWRPIRNGEALRVTKGKGKWLKLQLRSTMAIAPELVEVVLLDNATRPVSVFQSGDESFKIESVTESRSQGVYIIDFDMKVDRMSKHIQFRVQARSCPGGEVIFDGRSSDFAAHNNGKAKGAPLEEDSDSSGPISPPLEPALSAPLMRGAAITASSPKGVRRPSGPVAPVSSASVDPRRQPADPSPPASKRQRVPPPEPVKVEPAVQPEMVPVNAGEPPDEGPADPGFASSVTMVPGNLEVHGTVRARSFAQFSDLRLKADIKDIADALDVVISLSGKTFTWRSEELSSCSGGRRVIGFIAQEVRRVIPEVVHEDANGVLSVSYIELVPVIVEAFKQHLAQTAADKLELRAQIADIYDRLDTVAASAAASSAAVGPGSINDDDDVDSSESAGRLETSDSSTRLLKRRRPVPVVTSLIKRYAPRLGTLFIFLAGLSLVMLGSVLLAHNLMQPDQTITTSVMTAVDLRQMDPDGAADPYVEVAVGAKVFKTRTVWNTTSPNFWETFTITVNDQAVSRIVYQLWDDDLNWATDPRRMGTAMVDLSTVQTSQEEVTWLNLTKPTASGPPQPTVNVGQLQVSVLVTTRPEPAYEVCILLAGMFLVCVALVLFFAVSLGASSSSSGGGGDGRGGGAARIGRLRIVCT